MKWTFGNDYKALRRDVCLEITGALSALNSIMQYFTDSQQISLWTEKKAKRQEVSRINFEI